MRLFRSLSSKHPALRLEGEKGRCCARRWSETGLPYAEPACSSRAFLEPCGTDMPSDAFEPGMRFTVGLIATRATGVTICGIQPCFLSWTGGERPTLSAGFSLSMYAVVSRNAGTLGYWMGHDPFAGPGAYCVKASGCFSTFCFDETWACIRVEAALSAAPMRQQKPAAPDADSPKMAIGAQKLPQDSRHMGRISAVLACLSADPRASSVTKASRCTLTPVSAPSADS